MRWSSSSRGAALAPPLALLALGLLGATCEEQDYTAPDRLVLDNAPAFEPRVIELEQPFRGLNSVDYRITNTGADGSRFGLFAAVSYETEDDDGLPVRVESSTSRVTEALAAGEADQGRLFETELGLGERVHVEFLCYDDETPSDVACSGVLELTVLIRQVECRVDSDCSANEECDTSRGLCATAGEQDTSCQTAGAGSMPWGWLVPVALALAGLVGLRYRRGAP